MNMSNQLLMAYQYTHILRYLSKLIIEASIFSRWGSTQRPKMCRNLEISKYPALYIYILSMHIICKFIYTYIHMYTHTHHILVNAQGSLWKRGQKECRNQRQWMTTRKLYLRNTAGKLYIWTHRGCEKDPCMSITTQINAWSGGGGMKFQPFLRSS